MEQLLVSAFERQWVLVLAVAALLLAAAEVGYRHGLPLSKAGDEARRSQIGVVQGAVLGMLALLLGFTFSMAAERYDSRRDLVVEEANTIGTTWLRGSLLPEPHPDAVRGLLREYVDIRIRSREALADPVQISEGLRRSAEIHSALWQHAEAAAREAPNDITSTFVTALNDMIDTGALRVAAMRNRIPVVVWIILAVVAAAGCWTSAYAAGGQGVRMPLTNIFLPLLITVVIALIADLTSERQGIISVSQQPLIDLQNSIR